MNIMIRPMVSEDITRVVYIEQLSHAFPWSEAVFTSCLDSYYANFILYSPKIADGQSEQIIGYCILKVVAETCDLLNITITPDFRGQGLGRTLLHHACKAAQTRGAKHLLLEVRKSNQVALNLYSQEHFIVIGERKNYYPAGRGKRENAMILQRSLSGSEAR